MTKSKEWVCSSCGPIVTICRHLEALLPPMRDKKLVRVDVANFTQDVFHMYRPTFELGVFTEKMRGFGFVDEWDLELLTAKYFYNQSLRQIADEFNWCSFSTVRWRLKELHSRLVERGFKPRRRNK